MQIQDGKQPLGYSLHRFAEDQQRWHMSEVAETQFLQLANIQDTHLFTLELRGQGLCVMWRCQHPELFLELGFFLHRWKEKVRKISNMLQRTQCIKCPRIWVFPSQWEIRQQKEGAEWLIARRLGDPRPRQPHLQVLTLAKWARWLRSLIWSPWELLGAHPLSRTLVCTRITLLTFRTSQGQATQSTCCGLTT